MADYIIDDNLVSGVGTLVDGLLADLLTGGTVGGVGTLVDSVLPAGRHITDTVTGVHGLSAIFDLSMGIAGAAAYVSGTGVVTGQLKLTTTIDRNRVYGASELTGGFVRETQAASGAEAAYERTGLRGSFPILVYALAVEDADGTDSVPDSGSFIVSAGYLGALGEAFYEAGAGANAIGTKIQPSVGSAYLVFRVPVDNEVVWYQPTETLYRYELDRDTNVRVWKKYKGLMQRSLEGQQAFNMFDPDKAWIFYAKTCDAMMYQWSYDSTILMNQYDPDRCSHFYLSSLASNYGLVLDYTEPLPVRRAKTKTAVTGFKFKGLDHAVRTRLRALGYTGYTNEIWVKPTNVGNFESTVLNAADLPSSSPTGCSQPVDCKEYPHGYRTDDGTDDGYVPSSRVAVHLNDGSGDPITITGAIKAAVAGDLMTDVLPMFVDVRWFVTDVSIGDEGIVVTDELVITEV